MELRKSIVELLKPAPWIPMVNKKTLRADCIAGITGATIVLPQGVAFASIAGLPPEYGFYTAIVHPFIVALFGSSWHLVSGPTTAISVLVFGALAGNFAPGSEDYINAAIILACLVGVFQLVMGFARLGGTVSFVSHSVMVGFTAGAALLIALSQLDSALGIALPRPEQFTDFAMTLAENITSVHWASALIAGVSIVTAVLSHHFFPRSPYYLIALLAGTLTGLGIGAEEHGVNLVGAIPSVVPTFIVPQFSTQSVSLLAESALAIALIGLLEAVSVSRAIANKSRQRLDSNREFVGQGLSNAIGGFFGAYAGSGSFTRSGVNYDSGAKTPLAAVFSSIFLLIILLAVAPLFAYLPIPSMAGVIILVAWRLVDVQEIKHIIETSRSEMAIVLVTFCTTIFVNLEFAIYAGVLLSLVLFLEKSSHPFFGITAPDPMSPGRMFRNVEKFKLKECPQMVFARLHGPLYFGSAEYLQSELLKIATQRPEQKHLQLILKGVGGADLPATEMLIEEARQRKQQGGALHLIVGENAATNEIEKFHVPEIIGRENIHYNKGDAIAKTIPLLDITICNQCTARIFSDCPPLEKQEEPKQEQQD